MKEDIQESGIVVKGYVGTWYILDTLENDNNKQYILEHEEYGDSVSLLLTDDKFNCINEVDQDNYYISRFSK